MKRREFLGKSLEAGLILANPPMMNTFASDLESKTKIAFGSLEYFYGSYIYDIYTINPDGSDLKNLTNNNSMNYWPSWSPDGRKIAFMSTYDIHSINSDGSGIKRLTYDGTYRRRRTQPSCFPNGKHIAYVKEYDGIYIMDSDGSNQELLIKDDSPDLYYYYYPSCSPDGTKILFCNVKLNYAEYRGARHWSKILLMDLQNNNLIYLDDGFYPSWSPDGKKIVYSKLEDGSGYSSIWEMDANGSNKKYILNINVDSFLKRPTWSPDCSMITFYGWGIGKNGIYIMNSDGTNQTYLTDGFSPAWSPYLTETSVENKQPTEFSLHQNYPNPFNSSTLIKYQLPEKSNVSLDVYNVSGQKVKTLVDKLQDKGIYNVNFNASDLPSGMFFYQLRTQDTIKTQKMMLVK